MGRTSALGFTLFWRSNAMFVHLANIQFMTYWNLPILTKQFNYMGNLHSINAIACQYFQWLFVQHCSCLKVLRTKNRTVLQSGCFDDSHFDQLCQHQTTESTILVHQSHAKSITDTIYSGTFAISNEKCRPVQHWSLKDLGIAIQ